MNPSTAAENLLRDVLVELIEKAAEARQEAHSSGSRITREADTLALYEAVSLISQQAEAFGIPLQRLGLESLDVDRDLL